VSGADDARTWRAQQAGAVLAGAAIEAGMLGAAHALANPLSARHGVAHGLAVAATVGPVVRETARAQPQVYRELEAALCLGRGELPDALAALLGLLGLPPVMPPDADVDMLTADALTQWTLGFHPVAWGADEIARVYRQLPTAPSPGKLPF
jgi:alcohol dehydrogenase